MILRLVNNTCFSTTLQPPTYPTPPSACSPTQSQPSSHDCFPLTHARFPLCCLPFPCILTFPTVTVSSSLILKHLYSLRYFYLFLSSLLPSYPRFLFPIIMSLSNVASTSTPHCFPFPVVYRSHPPPWPACFPQLRPSNTIHGPIPFRVRHLAL